MINVSGKVILITGGYGYLGKSISIGLKENGAQVYVLGKSEDKFNEAFPLPSEISFIECDVSSIDKIKSAFEKVKLIEGKIDVVINNAFYLKGQDPENLTDENFQFSMDGVVGSVFRCIKSIIPFYKGQGFGKIINVSSMYGIIAPDFDIYKNAAEYLNPPHYGMGKSGVIQLTKYYASYLGKFNVQVNAISPGPFPNNKVKENKEFIKSLEKKTVLNRVGQPEDLVGAFVLFSSNFSDFITGHNLVIDGGWTIT